MDRQTDLTRRSLLQRGVVLGAGVGLGYLLTACSPTEPDQREDTTTTPKPSRILLAYFSRPGENYWYGGRRTLQTGNTELLARMVSDRIGCDTYRIEAADPYPERYDPTVARNVREQDGDTRPRIADALPDLGRYDTVLLGSPIWNVRPPMIMSTFVDAVDVSGKTIHPFVTYAVSGLGSTQSVYRDLNSGARIGAGLAVQGEEVADNAGNVDQWLRTAALA